MQVGRPKVRTLRRRLAFALLALVVVAGPQLAALGALGRFLGRTFGESGTRLLPALAFVALVLNLALLLEFARVFKDREIPRLLRWALFYPFYAWWFGSVLFAVFGGGLQLVTLPFVLAGLVSPLVGPVETAFAFGAYALGLVGIVTSQVRLRPEEVEAPVEGLPAGWQGARIVQVSDVHAGCYVGLERVRDIAAAAADMRADLVVVTGDLVHDSASFAAETARVLASIPSRLGTFACLGNHDYDAGAEEVASAMRDAGIHLLRNEGLALERGGDRVWLAGVDEAWFQRTDLARALQERPAGMRTILLSHHPELFPEAARRDVHLQFSGHTHGGQIGLPRLHPSLSLYRLISPFVAGLYRFENALLYVSRGFGTVQPLVRLGVPPEVTVLTLRAGSPTEAAAQLYAPQTGPG